jgi:hypothetical protein
MAERADLLFATSDVWMPDDADESGLRALIPRGCIVEVDHHSHWEWRITDLGALALRVCPLPEGLP